jgi:hypothetical protein
VPPAAASPYCADRLIGLAIGSAIAALAPFDVGFDLATGGSAVVRVVGGTNLTDGTRE